MKKHGIPVTNLRFETAWSYPYPIVTTGSGAALTICLREGDPYLAFLTQTTSSDNVLYLHTFDGTEAHRMSVRSTNAPDIILAFDPDTSVLTSTQVAALSPNMSSPHGLACNGFFFVRGGGLTLELWATSGIFLGARDYAGRGITGLSASPWSYCF